MAACHLRISGRVQGVGYRYAFASQAEKLGITGWVRNRDDGSVEALVQGEARAVEAIVAWARHGPPAAQVLEVRVAPVDPESPHTSFELRPTA